MQVHSVSWSSDGSRLASGSFDKTVTIWTLESDRLVSGWSSQSCCTLRGCSLVFCPSKVYPLWCTGVDVRPSMSLAFEQHVQNCLMFAKELYSVPSLRARRATIRCTLVVWTSCVGIPPSQRSSSLPQGTRLSASGTPGVSSQTSLRLTCNM